MKVNVALVAMLAIAIILIAPLSMTSVKASWVPQADINLAIAKGLAYLNNTQIRDGGIADGTWEYGYYGGVPTTALAVLCFENNGHLPDGDPVADPYVDVVRRGLDYLLSMLARQNIGPQTRGNPDTNGNGYGICDPWGLGYLPGMVIMALVASGNKSRVATPILPGRTFIAEVDGHTYEEIVREIVDFAAWAQCDDGDGRGGWRYGPYDNATADSDNSISPWYELGLHTAALWGLNAPAFVKTELENYWLNYSQNDVDGGFGYDSPWWSYISDTAGGIIGLDYCGVSASDERVVNATNWLNTHWFEESGWSVNFGNLYAMYNVMKGCRLAIPPIGFIGTHDWYNEYAEVLIGNQSAFDGSWLSWRYSWASVGVDTCFGILILQYAAPVVVKYNLTVNVKDANTLTPISGALVNVVGLNVTSGTTDGGQVFFEGLLAGDYLISASKAGYNPNSMSIFLNDNMEITILLTPSGPPAPVGGFEIPTDKAKTYALLIALGSVISLAALALIKRKKKNE